NCGTREVVDQYRGGVVLKKRFDGGHSVRVRGYGLTRDFDTVLPCPFVDQTAFDRSYYGGGAEYGWAGDLFGRPNRFVAGFEVTTQEDDRQRFDNSPTGVRGAVTESALEGVDTWGIYFQNELLLTDTVAFTISGRFESLDFDLEDKFLTDGDDSGGTTFEEFTPMAGIVWSPRDWLNLYANISTSFETPTLNQLDNPAGAGFNPAVDAQTSTNYEIGAKGLVGDRIRYEVAFFTIDLEDELVPFDVGGDTFFRNAGESTRAGMELAGQFLVFDGLTATVAYTLNDFEYDRYIASGMVFDGNDIPGLPEATFFAELAYRSDTGWYAIWDILHVGDMFANDNNSVASKVDSYRVSSLRFGRDFRFQDVTASPFFGVNNLFEEEYFANVRINQGFNRYFEPAPDRNVFGGLNVRFPFGR
ncbi:MAG: TonB-dependent receptor, partial [Gammaproteobacteria bacterium]|nr:TonB-dependent receptor [Gammaproteobacteria bacterium]